MDIQVWQNNLGYLKKFKGAWGHTQIHGYIRLLKQALKKYHRLGGLNKKNSFSHSCGG